MAQKHLRFVSQRSSEALTKYLMKFVPPKLLCCRRISVTVATSSLRAAPTASAPFHIRSAACPTVSCRRVGIGETLSSVWMRSKLLCCRIPSFAVRRLSRCIEMYTTAPQVHAQLRRISSRNGFSTYAYAYGAFRMALRKSCSAPADHKLE